MTLVLESVTRRVGPETHIRDVSLALPKGSLNVLLGQTLAGKTSLMRLMAGLDAPSEGRIRVDGADVTGWPVQRRNVAMVYQQFINYPSLSVYENIASPLRVARLPRAEIEARVREAARLLKLEPHLGRRPLELSGGQQQRTALARALVKRADLVLMDEPLANLDYKLREELREELPRIFAETGAVFVYATTEPAEALLLGGHTAALHRGRVTQFGPTPEVYRRPHDLTTAQVFSDPPLNTLRVVKANGRVTLPTGGQARAAGTFAGVPDGTYTLGFRAHHLALDPIPDAVALPATVSVAEITGSESFVHIDAGEHRLIALLAGVRRFEPGTAVTAYLDPRHALLFDAGGRTAALDLPAAA
ncbi:sn-glycerol-3-phosphate import ATP-binding protein UgpC [Methylobacterium crusticola]|uniref:Sn-glycerol-3-phosphate import ATP-binding protein UgpC n=1 Tax=Methylobacterium crusticola TaxID=1697972 RepID=A0ABQ4QXE9_9HYPH|nr:ABC transporter ATP-binding protein [Methylobacterium crusticola]GJD49889.1 sn-glycerol-3-phosphate import ATP-binding protein UgpC [Methylobacterium crusticola]